jgi:hydrogenase-4 component F
MPMVSGRPHHDQQHTPYRDTLMTVGPPLALMALVTMLGVWLPEPLQRLLQDAARLLEAGP